MAEDLAKQLNITLIVDTDAPPVQDFLRREYPADRAAAPEEPPAAGDE
jgi:hypothetical protein